MAVVDMDHYMSRSAIMMITFNISLSVKSDAIKTWDAKMQIKASQKSYKSLTLYIVAYV